MRGKLDDVRQALNAFRKIHPVALLSAFQETLETLERDKGRPVVLEIDFLLMLASVQMTRAAPGTFFDQKSARKAYWELFLQLEKASWGRLVVGRRGHQSRFCVRKAAGAEDGAWNLKSVLEDMKLPYYADDEPVDSQEKILLGPTRARVIEQIKAHKAQLREYGVSSLSLFGSVARDEAKSDSDVDLLVTFKDAVTSDSFFGLKFFLEDLLGRRIDLVTSGALREPIRQAIEPELLRVA
jgi:predicted nucleotidyltransferase